MDSKVIFIAGPQGCGKGTQGKKLAERLGFLFWGMGGMLREISKSSSPLAERVAIMDDGTLLPDDLIIEVLKERLAEVPHDQGIVFDGVPRTIGQAEFLIPFLQRQDKKNMATIFLDLPREESMRRLLLRAKNESRVDDTPEGIEKRFEYYDVMMTPTLAFLKQETEFIAIDGRPSVEEIAKNIDTALDVH
jgi:adenylate kinase